MEIADKWIQQGYQMTKVLQIVGVSQQTYYHRKKNQGKVRLQRGGRPIPGYSLDQKQRPIPDLQIKDQIWYSVLLIMKRVINLQTIQLYKVQKKVIAEDGDYL